MQFSDTWNKEPRRMSEKRKAPLLQNDIELFVKAKGKLAKSLVILLSPVFVTGLKGCDIAKAQETEIEKIAPIVIIGTRSPKPVLELPASVGVLERDEIQTALPNLQPANILSKIPGVYAKDRGLNFTQDAKITLRGFGARAQFGIREIKIFWDNIPLTMADGQADIDKLDLSFIERIEVLKGPLAVLYGNAAGGVIYFQTEEGPPKPVSLGLRVSGGRFGLHKENLRIGGQVGRLNYMLGLTTFYIQGFREHSSARRNYANLKLNFSVTNKSLITLVARLFDEPVAQQPGGLTKEEFEEDPTQAASIYKRFDTKEIIQNKEAGIVYQQDLSKNSFIKFTGYYGKRDFTGYIPFNINKFVRDYYGVGLSLHGKTKVYGRRLEIIVGADADFMKEDRNRYRNENGSRGDLKYTQDSDVNNYGIYSLLFWEPFRKFELGLGVRHSNVKFGIDRRGDSAVSGDRSFEFISWVVTSKYEVTKTFNVYAGIGSGFMTPTLIELTNSIEPNPDIKEAEFLNYEIGLRSAVGEKEKTFIDAALFLIKTRDELIPREASPGQNYYVNAGKTERKGLELYLLRELPYNFYTSIAYTYLDAKYKEFIDENNNNLSGKRIPGLPNNFLTYEFGWKYLRRTTLSMDVKYVDKVYANDENTASADGYIIANVKGSYNFNMIGYKGELFFRVENVFDKKYVSSVIPNARRDRFYEPGPGRNYYVGVGLEF